MSKMYLIGKFKNEDIREELSICLANRIADTT